MKYQKERCLKCGTLRRPTDLESKHDDVLDETGQFLVSDFWFCSDECFEAVLETFMEPEYSLKYDFGTLTYGYLSPGEESSISHLPPVLAKQAKHLMALFKWGFEYRSLSIWQELFKNDFGRYPQPDEVPVTMEEVTKRIREAADEWRFQQDLAIDRAKVKMNDELTAEDIHLLDIESAKRWKDLDAGAQQRQREEEKKRKEAEREGEKRRKEEEQRAAKEAEEVKWRPRPWKI